MLLTMKVCCRGVRSDNATGIIASSIADEEVVPKKQLSLTQYCISMWLLQSGYFLQSISTLIANVIAFKQHDMFFWKDHPPLVSVLESGSWR